MRKTPILLSGFFIFVTLSRVSSFSAAMGDTTLSLVFSIGLGLTVFVASYWTQYQGNTKPTISEAIKIEATVRFSWFVLLIAVLIDGAFNLADVLSENTLSVFVVIYGLTPTTISLLLGILQARIDALPTVRSGWSYAVGKTVKTKINSLLSGQKAGQKAGQKRTNTQPNVRSELDKKPDILPDKMTYTISKKAQLTSEMIEHLSNGYTTYELKSMFPNVHERTLRRWKAEIK